MCANLQTKNKNKNNDDYAGDHCIEIYVCECIANKISEQQHSIYRFAINLCIAFRVFCDSRSDGFVYIRIVKTYMHIISTILSLRFSLCLSIFSDPMPLNGNTKALHFTFGTRSKLNRFKACHLSCAKWMPTNANTYTNFFFHTCKNCNGSSMSTQLPPMHRLCKKTPRTVSKWPEQTRPDQTKRAQ